MNDPINLFTDGKAYERLMGRWSRLAGDKFIDWIEAPNNLSWIDVGCGNGAFTEVLIARCMPSAVTGVDPSDGQLSYARTRLGAKMAQFRLADAQSLPFADNTFDAATMALAITFIADPAKAAREMRRVTRSGGIVATYMWDILGGGLPFHPLTAAMKSLELGKPARPNVEASRRETMQAIWKEAGLQSLDTTVIRIAVAYADFEDFWQSNSAPIGPSGKVLAELSPSMRDKLKARVRELLPIAPDGRIAYEAFANAVKGHVP